MEEQNYYNEFKSEFIGSELAIKRGWLKFGEFRNEPAWCIEDLHCAEWRKLSHETWWRTGPTAIMETGSRCDNGIGHSDAITREIVFILFNPYDALIVLSKGITAPHSINTWNVIDKIGTIIFPRAVKRIGQNAIEACRNKFVVVVESHQHLFANDVCLQLESNGCKVFRIYDLNIDNDTDLSVILSTYEKWTKNKNNDNDKKENNKMPKMIMVTDMLKKKHTSHKNEVITYSWHGADGKRLSFVLNIPNDMVEQAKRPIRSTAQIGIIENSSCANILIGDGYPFNLTKASNKRVAIKWAESGVEFMEKFFPLAHNVELKVKQISEGCITIELPMKMVHDYLKA